MFLHAAFIPPPLAREAINHAVQSALPAAATNPPRNRRRPGLGRLTGRSVQVAEPPGTRGSGFELVPAGRLHVPVAAFGNVAMRDAIKVAQTLMEEATHWATPTVHFAGAVVRGLSDHRADHRVLALALGGEVDALMSIAESVTHRVHTCGFRFDRHALEPVLVVATISGRVTTGQVDDLLGALECVQLPPWTVGHVSLVKRSFDTTSFASLEYQRIPLGRH